MLLLHCRVSSSLVEMICLVTILNHSPGVLLVAVHNVRYVRSRGGGLQVLVEASSSSDGFRWSRVIIPPSRSVHRSETIHHQCCCYQSQIEHTIQMINPKSPPDKRIPMPQSTVKCFSFKKCAIWWNCVSSMKDKLSFFITSLWTSVMQKYFWRIIISPDACILYHCVLHGVLTLKVWHLAKLCLIVMTTSWQLSVVHVLVERQWSVETIVPVVCIIVTVVIIHPHLLSSNIWCCVLYTWE